MEGKEARTCWAPGLELMGQLRADGFRVEHTGVDASGRQTGIATYTRRGAIVEQREALEVDDGARLAWYVRQEAGDRIPSHLDLRAALRMQKEAGEG
jgi:hypothetical protein